jgi:hypothetical protein
MAITSIEVNTKGETYRINDELWRRWPQLTYMYVPDRDIMWNGPSMGEISTQDTDWRIEILVLRLEHLETVKQD